MNGLRFLTLGIGDAFSALHYSSCFALESDGRWLLIDCPHPIRKMMREAGQHAGLTLDVGNIDAVVLSHLHADHSSGLEGLGFFSRYVLGRRMPILTHPEVAVNLWDRRLAGGMEWSLQEAGQPPERRSLDEFFDVVPLAGDQSRAIGPFTVRCRRTIHSVPTIAVQVEAGGRSLGYSADTSFDLTLIDWLSSADVIVHEASGGFMHTPLEALAALPYGLRQRIRLIHCPDVFDPASSDLEMLRQGKLYVV